MNPSAEQMAADTVRAKVAELNAALTAAYKLDINIEIDVRPNLHLNGTLPVIEATLSKKL